MKKRSIFSLISLVLINTKCIEETVDDDNSSALDLETNIVLAFSHGINNSVGGFLGSGSINISAGNMHFVGTKTTSGDVDTWTFSTASFTNCDINYRDDLGSLKTVRLSGAFNLTCVNDKNLKIRTYTITDNVHTVEVVYIGRSFMLTNMNITYSLDYNLPKTVNITGTLLTSGVVTNLNYTGPNKN